MNLSGVGRGFAGVDAVDGIEGVMGRVVAGEVRGLARAISLMEAGGAVAEALQAGCRRVVKERAAAGMGRALRVGVTGAPGVGKSTLVDRMARALRTEGVTVGVLAVDPTSPYSGGALLGDRIRMQGFCGDDGVFIRSLATRGVSGGVGASAEGVCLAMEAAGREVVVIETVGVGQDEVAVTGLADVVVVVLAPGMGDDVQAMKAGLMEAADVFVVNKADGPGAQAVEAEIVGMQGLGMGGKRAPVVRTVAATGEGVDRLLAVVREVAAARLTRGGGREAAGIPGWGVLRVDHLGIAVRSMVAARGFYEGLGLEAGVVETVESEGVKVMMLPVGESRVELLEAMAEDTTIGRFVARRGEGLHHVALRVGDVDGMFAKLKGQGVRLVSDAVKVGAGGHRYFFVHPEGTGGVLVEMVGEAR